MRSGQTVTLSLKHGPVTVHRSTRLRPEPATITVADGQAAITVVGNDLEIDFQGATLSGCPDVGSAKRDRFVGVGVDVTGCRNVTIRNARIHGYRRNVQAVDSPGLRLIDCDLSWSRAQILVRSGKAIDRWLELRSLKEWNKGGAGVWLEGCTGAEVMRVVAGGSQNGLVLVGCLDSRVVGCDVSHNSGWGIALWASSQNLIAWNRADFVNRPWKGGWGGDAAALVLVNECHRNYIVANSLTHGGDGLFLTDRTNGGYDPVERCFRPLGGCNDNVIAYNDGSHSTNNAFEATFSARNVFYRNYANDSRYGLWLGFSESSWILENEVCRNAIDGIAIEHGRAVQAYQNTIVGNRRVGIHLWGDRADAQRSHPSTDMVIAHNTIRDSALAVSLVNCTDYLLHENECIDAAWPPGLQSTKATSDPDKEQAHYDTDGWFTKVVNILALRPATFSMRSSESGPSGVQWLLVDTYGPRNFKGLPAAWRQVGDRAVELHLLDSSLARYRIETSAGVLMESPVIGTPFRASGPPGGEISIHHQDRVQRIAL